MTDLQIKSPEGFTVSVIHNDGSDTVMVHDKTSGDRVSQCRFLGRVWCVFPESNKICVYVQQGGYMYYANFPEDQRELTQYIATGGTKDD